MCVITYVHAHPWCTYTSIGHNRSTTYKASNSSQNCMPALSKCIAAYSEMENSATFSIGILSRLCCRTLWSFLTHWFPLLSLNHLIARAKALTIEACQIWSLRFWFDIPNTREDVKSEACFIFNMASLNGIIMEIHNMSTEGMLWEYIRIRIPLLSWFYATDSTSEVRIATYELRSSAHAAPHWIRIQIWFT